MNVKLENAMLVISVNFNTDHKKMLIHSKQLLEEDHISINKKFDKLITSLRTAVETEGPLTETTSFNDIFDAFRLSLKYYKLNG